MGLCFSGKRAVFFEENGGKTVALCELHSERGGQRSLTLAFGSGRLWGCFSLGYLHQVSTQNAYTGERMQCGSHIAY